MNNLAEIWVYLAREPLAALTATLLAWLAAQRLARAARFHPMANPVLFAVALLAGVVGWMVFAIGPALECARAALPAERRGLAGPAQGYGVVFLSLLVSAPSLFWGLRVSVAALSDP